MYEYFQREASRLFYVAETSIPGNNFKKFPYFESNNIIHRILSIYKFWKYPM